MLHRDIKPANCFIDGDGTVKIGDFGLSISTAARDVTQLTMAGTFQGTPQFAPPEQMRGEPLDVRADIYAVGATLYYLLTGQPPFDDNDLMALVTRIATEVPRSPRALAAARAVASRGRSCCAASRKTGRRVRATYAALTDDAATVQLHRADTGEPGTPRARGNHRRCHLYRGLHTREHVRRFGEGCRSLNERIVVVGFGCSWGCAYYSVLEGYWSASIGKRVCRLRVTRRDGQRPGLGRALVRALLFQTPSFLAILPYVLLGQGRWLELAGFVRFWSLLRLGALRSAVCDGAPAQRICRRPRVRQQHTCRRTRQGSGPTCSRQRAGCESRPDLATAHRSLRGRRHAGRDGHRRAAGGFDPALRRRVWVQVLPSGAPPAAALVRNISRPGRLRWLSGRRTASESWDAYEALDGVPFVSVVARPDRGPT